MQRARLLCALPALALVLSACGLSAPQLPQEADFQRAETLMPANADLNERYQRSCRVCHIARSGAPLAGHAPSWQPRLTQGTDVLLARVKDGYSGMPARGLCSDCSDEDLRQLIDFLAQGR